MKMDIEIVIHPCQIPSRAGMIGRCDLSVSQADATVNSPDLERFHLGMSGSPRTMGVAAISSITCWGRPA